MLFHLIEYGLDQLNNKHTKIEVNLTIQYFEYRSQNKCLLDKYQAFGLMKMHNMSKI